MGEDGRISTEIWGTNMPLENHNSVYYVASFRCGSRRLNRDYGCLVWLSVDLCVVVVMVVFKSQKENIRQVKDRRLRWGWMEWHNE